VADDRVVKVRGEQELAARAGHLFADVRAEFVCAGNDLNTWSRPTVRAGIAQQMRTRLHSGVTVRKLYTGAALVDGEQRRHLLEIAAYGAQVRISAATLPNETIIVDWRAMVLAGPNLGGDREFTVTTAPSLIEGMRTFFEATWQGAVELADYLRQDLPHVDPEGKRILQALAAGLTDQAAARQIGVSVRTYRRRVAELMKLLESESRFQAGVRAGTLGLAR
jgi:DNA-binding NarL/FixJ family response regulator